jgi:hypothetical protein
VKNRFQNLPFKFNLQRYTKGGASGSWGPASTEKNGDNDARHRRRDVLAFSNFTEKLGAVASKLASFVSSEASEAGLYKLNAVDP